MVIGLYGIYNINMKKYLYYVAAVAVIGGVASVYLINNSEMTIAFLKVVEHGFMK